MTFRHPDDLDARNEAADRARGDEWLAEQALDRKQQHAPAPESLADFYRRQGDRLERLWVMCGELQRTIDDFERRYAA